MGVGFNLKHTKVCTVPAVVPGIIFIPDGTTKSDLI